MNITDVWLNLFDVVARYLGLGPHYPRCWGVLLEVVGLCGNDYCTFARWVVLSRNFFAINDDVLISRRDHGYFLGFHEVELYHRAYLTNHFAGFEVLIPLAPGVII